MKVRVKMFAMARQMVGTDQLDVELPENSSVGELRASLLSRFPNSAPLLRSSLIAIDTNYASDDTRISPHSEIAVIPPVSGG